MSFFKELWFMVKALFKSKPSEKDFVEIKQMEHFPFKGYLAMSWCGYLLTRYSTDNIDNETVNHETIHFLLKCAKVFKKNLYWVIKHETVTT